MLGLLASVILAQAAVPPDSIISQPDWVRKPGPERIAELYPSGAASLGHPGHVVLECKVRADGALETCRVTEESPSGEGFGDAALRMSGAFQMKPLSIDGKPVGGGTVRIPIQFLTATGQLDPLSGTLKCYGRMAAAAEANSADADAWLGVRFWILQALAAAASSHLQPSRVENELTAYRVSAAEQRSSQQVRYETDECTRAMNRALGANKPTR